MLNTLHDLRRSLERDPELSESKRLFVLNVIERHEGVLERWTRRRMARVAEAREIRDLAEPAQAKDYVYRPDDDTDTDGVYVGDVVAVVTWSRDCDHVCGESRSLIPATLRAYDAFRERQLHWAEGPMSFRLQRRSEPFRSWSRDMVMEAHEDGHRHSVVDAYGPAD